MQHKKNIIFTDGACSGNPGPGGWGVVALIGETVHEIGGGSSSTTNNIMELEAACQALELRERLGVKEPTILYVDSKYVLGGVGGWIRGWKQKGWTKADGAPVLNRPHWERIDELCTRARGQLEWVYVPGHADVAGNERVDEIAVAYSKGEAVELFVGPVSGYPDLRAGIDAKSLKNAQASKKPRSKAPKNGYYLSLLDGKLLRHDTWGECEARVKGKSGAKFKKVATAGEEADVLKGWGIG